MMTWCSAARAGCFWGSLESQRIRYQVFLQELPLAGSDVVEVGCGFDFLAIAAEDGAPRRYWVST